MKGIFRRLTRRWGVKTVVLGMAAAIAVVALGGGVYAALGGTLRQSSASDINLQKGLVGWWKLDGNAKDSSPYRNNGTLSGTIPTADRKNAALGALSFNGTSDYVDAGNPPQLQITGSQTISMWLKPSDFAVRRNPYAKAYGGEGTITQETTGMLSYYYGISGSNGGTYQGLGSSAALTLNQWNHVVIVRDLSAMKLRWYINGTMTSEAGASYGAAAVSSLPAYIGKGYVSNYAGSIDDVRVYNRALSADEVKALYSQYDPGVQAASGEKGLVGWWKLDGNAKDSSPFRNNGTVNGATLAADRKGRASSAYTFNGTSNDIHAATAPQYNSPYMSVSAWIYMTSDKAFQTAVGRYDQAGAHNGDWILGQGLAGQYRFSVQLGGSLVQTASTTGFTLNTWHYMVGTFDGSAVRLYIDGVNVSTASYAGTLASNSEPIYIGFRQNYNIGWNGNLDDVRLYNRALSADEIMAQYNSYDSQINLNSSPTATTSGGNINQGLTGYWNFNGNAHDSTPYRDNGTLTGQTFDIDRRGRAASSVAFPVAASSVVMVNGNNIFTQTDALTVNLWLKVDSIGDYYAIHPVMKFADTSGANYILYLFGTTSAIPGRLGWYANAGGTWGELTAYYTIPIGTWFMATLTYTSAGGGQLYINGSPIAGSGGTGALATTTAPLKFEMQDGNIDDVRIYNRALSASEVQALYNARD